ncbi:MAG: N-acetylmuramoyl-L-alanine amidase [Betaproteobacteria bacterium]|nr:MAG: N-acetylmuramoyl-L-alanine amidase [Betaproteobacteria bacterium]
MPFKPDQIIVHHDGVSREGPSFGIVDDFHESLGFPISSLGFCVGYHYWIERDGVIRQARAENELGAHTKGQNYTALGIGMAGCFDKEDPSPEQVAALGLLLSNLCSRHDIPAERIFPHRKYANKSCYGSRLSDHWAQDVLADFRKKDAAEAKEAATATFSVSAAPLPPGWLARVTVAFVTLCKAVLNSRG